MSKVIAQALNNVMAKVSYIQKTGKNSFHGYKYASEADLLEKLRPAMTEEGLVFIPSFESGKLDETNGNTEVIMSYTLVHRSGEIWPEKIRAVGCGNDRAKNGTIGDKGVYKAITGANKYLLFKMFQIETGDDPEHDEQSIQIPPKVKDLPFSSGTAEEVDAYMKLAEMAIGIARDANDLKVWWKEEADNRYKYGISEHTIEYQTLQKMVKERLAVLKKGENHEK